jgi:predicted glycoside hydrolase/deacetylase ChbG (UPF0249 family)
VVSPARRLTMHVRLYMNIIINADDLGYSNYVNDRIFSLVEARRITSATLLANAPAFEDAAAGLRSYSYASFGVHLNITEFAPLSRNSALDPLLDRKGRFAMDIRRMSADSRLIEAVYGEWSEQVRRVRESGVRISHIDSHHHMHTAPKLFWILKRLQREFKVSKVRLSRNIFSGDEKIGLQKHAAKVVWNTAVAAWGRTKTTDGFGSFKSFHDLMPHSLPHMRFVELMCHPGNTQYEEEAQLIAGKWRAGWEQRLKLISYNEL